MPTVSYQYELPYAYDLTGKRFPRLTFRVSKAANRGRSVDVDAYLDSGAERSLFSGRIGALLGIDVLGGPRIGFETLTGGGFSATLHPVRLSHSVLGTFDLEVGFSLGEIERNILGRDFFDLVQIGFREHHLTFFVTPTP